VVECRALTVALMDRLLVPVRQHLLRGADFLLPHMLQGDTWRPAGPSSDASVLADPSYVRSDP
jgi:hypothetical protein